MAIQRRYLIFGFLALLAALVSSAQPVATEGAKGRFLSVVGLPDAKADYTNLVLLVANQPHDLSVKAGARSAPISLTGSVSALSLAHRTQDPKTGKPSFTPLAQLTWPDAKTNQALLIVGMVPGAKTMRGILLDDSLTAFPIHTIRVLNVSGVSLMSKINDFSGDLKPGAISPVISYPDMSKLGPNSAARYPFALGFKNPDGSATTLSSGYFDASQKTRSLIIIQAPAEANSSKVRIKTIIDRPAPPSPPVRK